MSRTHLLAAHDDDPLLDELARAVFEMFPECIRCGRRIERVEDADVRLLRNRLVHRVACSASRDESR
jgi:hypothetical protein